MSKRLLQRGRYPRGPGIEHIASTNSQLPQTTAAPYPTGSEVPFYSSQSQAGQNIWTPPSYPTPNNYPNQVTHQHVPESSNYWSGGQNFPVPQQPPPNEQWNWKAENSAESASYPNFQQPMSVNPTEQWQQIPYSQVENQNYSQQQAVSYNSVQQYHPMDEYQHTNNNSSSSVLNPSLLPPWENGSLNFTQPEQLPWTYSTPQYCNSSSNSVADFSQNSNVSSTNISSWTYNSDYDANSSIHAQDISSNYLPSDNMSCTEGVIEPQSNFSDPEQKVVNESEDRDKLNIPDISSNVVATSDVLGNSQELSVETEYENSTLSAFFQNTDQETSANTSEHDDTSTPEIQTVLDTSSLTESMGHLQIHESEKNSLESDNETGHDQETDDDGNQENNFFQEEENLDSSDESSRLKSNSVSPAGFVEEPINQEVPEPNTKDSTSSKIPAKQDYHQISTEEPLNQQVPIESGQKSRSTSSERERMVIRPREESPFKPPRLANTSKGTVVQKEVVIQNLSEVKKLEDKTVVQEVNLETFPDNLERPPDYEELRKQSPLYVSHQKHLRNELNSSPSSLLCDNLDIPCVTFAPAAPPLHSSSKSDKSESSNDSKKDVTSLVHSSNSSLNSKEPNAFASTMDETESYDKPIKTNHSSSLNNIVQVSSENKLVKTSSQKYNGVSSAVTNEANNVQNKQFSQSLYLKDSKIKEVRKGEQHRKHVEQLPSPIKSQQKDSKWSMDYEASLKSRNGSEIDRKTDQRSASTHLDSRQRFADQKYPSFDERQYYSDRERSRPPSRSSLGERTEDYMFQKPEDYMYAPNGERRRAPPEYARPSSRMSESDMNRADRHGHYDYYQQQYPYAGGYQRSSEYYQRPRGYEYDPYQRDPYYAQYYDAYRYAYSNYNYGFYDELYRNDPRYRQYREEQYRQYYAKYGYDADYERSSVHSGRSSANELSKDIAPSSRYAEPDIDSNESEFSSYNMRQDYQYDVHNDSSSVAIDQSSASSARLTPVKFSYGHPIARFSPGGMLITAVPSQIDTTLAPLVKIQSLQVVMENEESFQELKNYQGPLVRGLAHKNDVIEFCTQKIKSIQQKSDVVDRDSYILLWELMVLLLRQNGSVAGSDIAELLLKDHEVLRPLAISLRHATETPLGEHSPADVNDSSSQSHAGDTSSPDEGIVVLSDKSSLNTSRTVDIDKVTRKFREFLLFGHKKDALEWAMKHGLWGHALFLASKMDLRTYANVMTRFANSLALNDPLQTLYQLMSGRQPSAVTCVADKKWGDWRPHLAMILSNPSSHPDVDSRSITTLGDTLASRGCLAAAHFCYVMAQVDFGTYEQKNSKIVLLSTDHRLPFEEFATNEAIQCTEIYEYAQSLANPSYMLIHLQVYKFIYALRLVEHGFLEEALHYCEVIAGNLQTHPSLFSIDFISEVLKLATRLKYHDPHFLRGEGELEDQDDPEWLKNLLVLTQNYNNIMQGQNSQMYLEQQLEQSQTMNTEPLSTAESLTYQNVSESVTQEEIPSSVNHMNYYQGNSWSQQNSSLQNSTLSNSHQENVAYYQGDVMSNQSSFHMDSSIPSHEENETTDVPSSPVTQTPPFDYYSGGTQQIQENKQPSYDQVNNFSNSSSHRERRESVMSSGSRYSSGSLSMSNKNIPKETQKSEGKKDNKPNTQAGKAWLGGIFSRFLPKAPNQMILPDDKNPTIVWDDVKNCWVNKDSNDDDESSAPLAPPTDMELMGSKSSENPMLPPGNSVPPISASPSTNKFQRPKTRIMRQNYVDVLNTSGATMKTNVPPEALFPSTFEQTNAPKMFIPSSAGPVGGENTSEFDPSHTSYGSSNLDTMEQPQMQSAPLMLDPAEFESRRSNINQRHTLGRTGRRTYPT